MELRCKDLICYSNMQDYVVRRADVEAQCLKARVYGLRQIAVLPSSLEITDRYLNGTDTAVYVGIAYPSGAYTPDMKAEEIAMLRASGHRISGYFAVLAVGRYLSGNRAELEEEIVRCLAAADGTPVWFVLEAAVLNDGQLAEICALLRQHGAAGVVSTTHFKPYGIPLAQLSDVARLQAAAGTLPMAAFAETAQEAEAAAAAGAALVLTPDPLDWLA